jgi:hypothetical protein
MFAKSIAALCLGFAGCSEGFRKLEDLGPLRVLAIQATNPELAPGASTQLSVLVSYLDQKPGETLTHSAVACPDPGIAQGAEIVCANPVPVLTETALSLSTAGKTQALTNLLNVSIPADYLAQVGGQTRDYLLIYTIRSSAGATVESFKRLRVSLASSPNQNPQFTDIQASGASLSAKPTDKTKLEPLVNDPELIVSWTSSQGRFESSRTAGLQPNSFTPDTESSLPFVLVAIARDLRGGVSFVIKEF